MLIFQMTSGGVTDKANTATPRSRVIAWLQKATLPSRTAMPRDSQACRHTSLIMADDEEMSSEDTVEMEAATGPMMATPASTGGSDSTITLGMMLSTLPP